MQKEPQYKTDTTDKIRSIIGAATTINVQQTVEQGLCLMLENQFGRAVISLFGGHVLSYINKADFVERLWLSPLAVFDGKTPIRGGIPICWPWFSSHPTHEDYPSHGYARTQMFTLVEVQETIQNSKVTGTKVILKPSQAKKYGYSSLDMNLVVTLSDTLTVDIITSNEGDQAIALTQALHSYFLVDDIRQIQLKGVDTPFDDKLTSTTNNLAPAIYKFAQEIDRIHSFEHAEYTNKQIIMLLITRDTAPQTQQTASLTVEQSGHNSIVVWNPWVDKSESMHDVQNNGYKTMLCVEAANTANVEHLLFLAPNQTHKLSQKIF
jgi:glucose-6-phosphate 1-epimerase